MERRMKEWYNPHEIEENGIANGKIIRYSS